jgi:hypothetical protein
VALREKACSNRLQRRKGTRAALSVRRKNKEGLNWPQCLAVQEAGHDAALHWRQGERAQMRLSRPDDGEAGRAVRIPVRPQTKRPT